jgi:hypothetical protein
MKSTTETITEIKVSYKPTKQAGPKITSSQLAYEYLRQLYDEETVAFHGLYFHELLHGNESDNRLCLDCQDIDPLSRQKPPHV